MKENKEKTLAKLLIGLIAKAEEKNIIRSYDGQQTINKVKVLLERMAI